MPRHQLQTEIEHTQQRQKALHLLILSGVVRPSDVKLHYAISPLNSDEQSHATQEKPVTALRLSSLLYRFFELMNWPTREKRSLRQYSSRHNRYLRFRKNLSMSTRFSL